jgi:protease II
MHTMISITPQGSSLLLVGCALVVALTGCSPAPLKPLAEPSTPSVGPTVSLAPPPALMLQGVPPVPQRMVALAQRYTDFAGHSLADWHPTQREMLVRHRAAGSNLNQLWRVAGPLAAPQLLTSGDDPVGDAFVDPQSGRFVVFERAHGGNEVYQLFRLDLAIGQVTQLSDPDQRHNFGLWLHGQAVMLSTSVPLDRTAEAGRRAAVTTQLWRTDPLQPAARSRLAELPGSGWHLAAITRDNQQLALEKYISANESQLWLMDLASGQRRQVLPAPGGAGPVARHHPVGFSADGRRVYLVSDRAGEFRHLMALQLTDGHLQDLTPDLNWDVDAASLSPDGGLVALRVNVDGRDELRLVKSGQGQAVALPALPAGSVVQAHFHPQRPELAFAINSAQGPSQLFTLDVGSGRVEPWTRARLDPALDLAGLSEQQIIRWRSFDGRTISGLINRPPARFAGPRPVFINIHGGPESQAKIGFAGRSNHLLQELGMVIIQPNVRGSSGYGKTFLALDNGRLREDSVKDIGALLDWIATQPDLDARRVVVSGGSYGGYMSLAVATHYADRIAGAVDVVGISHFVTFLQNTESYRRDLRRVEYGDERDPAMRELLHQISPLTQAHRITKPLFVVQGKNDPRVPYTEAEQIVAQARANRTPVWYMRAENEGHGFARKENADYQFYATVLFLQQVLGL